MKKKFIKIFITSYITFILMMLSAWSVWHIKDGGKMIPNSIAIFITNFASLPRNIYHYIRPTSAPSDIFEPRKIMDKVTAAGLKLYSDSSTFSSTYLLTAAFKTSQEDEFKLIQIPSGKIIKTWNIPEDFKKGFKTFPEKPRFNHPLMLKDSSLILKVAHNNILLSLSKNNKVQWVDTNYNYHHSTEKENDSTIWVSTTTKKLKSYISSDFINDAICAVDPRNGKIKYVKPVADILIENGYQNLLDIVYENDGIHINDIEPALYSSNYWKKGDLLISIRHKNSIFLYRPLTNKITWLKTGPWLAQHDGDFVNDKTIMVFGNDFLRQKKILTNGYNDIYFYDFEKDQISKPFTKVMKQVGIKTKTQGRCDLLKNGDLFIEETEAGKLYIINKDSLKMTYTERVDKNYIKMFNWVRTILN